MLIFGCENRNTNKYRIAFDNYDECQYLSVNNASQNQVKTVIY